MTAALKANLGKVLASRIVDGDTIVVGTGSTVDFAVEMIGCRISSEGLKVRAVVSSYQSAAMCALAGIEVIDLQAVLVAAPVKSSAISLGFDGADQVDKHCRAIKGKGAALWREKQVSVVCKEFVLLVDQTKVADNLGDGMPVPVECVPNMWPYVVEELKDLGAVEVDLRSGLPGKHGSIITEGGNVILDALFSTGIEPLLEMKIKSITGVVESGLFLTQASTVLVSHQDGAVTEWNRVRS
jgi:ribose 5-phosphate isomerase A